jgi:hypothetical protein
MFHVDFFEHVSSTIKAYASLASWAMVVCALNRVLTDYARFAHALFGHFFAAYSLLPLGNEP